MSRSRISALYWGILLIAVGIIFLAVELGPNVEPSDQEWSIILAAGSALCLLGYLIGEKRHWWVLFPSAALAANALAIWSENREMADNQLGGLVTMIMSIPFWVAILADRVKNRWALIPGSILLIIGVLLVFFEGQDEFFAATILFVIAAAFLLVFVLNREKWWPLIPANVLTAVAFVVLFEDKLADDLLGAAVMFVIALPFFVVFLVNRKNLWALVAGYVPAAIGLTVILASQLNAEWLAAAVLGLIAFPFLVVFLVNRKNWWALIPAYVLAAIGIVVLIASQPNDDWIATLVMFLIAFPFFVVYLRNAENWWALIPAGVLSSIGLGIIPVFLGASDEVLERLVGAIILAGIAVTFAAIWSRRMLTDTDWAKYPAVGCGLAVPLVLIFSMRIELFWAIALIALGIWIILRGQKPKLEEG